MNEIHALLKEWLGSDDAARHVLRAAGAEGVSDVRSASLVREEEWAQWGVPRIRARELVATLAAWSRTPPVERPTAGALLADVPDDRSLLALLQKGSLDTIDANDLAAAARVAFMHRHGLGDLEARIATRIEARALELERPCPPIYFELERVLVQREHAGVLGALDLPGTFVTERRQRELLARMPAMWRAIQNFDRALSAWDDEWRARASHPHAMLASLASVIHTPGAPLPSVTDAPPQETVLSAAREAMSAIRRTLAGTGLVVARALAERAALLLGLLRDERLLEATGAVDRDDLLRRLNVSVAAGVAQEEQAAVQYLLTLARVGEYDATQRVFTLVALRDLGRRMPWEALSGPPAPASTRG